jgi:hypothetical protein
MFVRELHRSVGSHPDSSAGAVRVGSELDFAAVRAISQLGVDFPRAWLARELVGRLPSHHLEGKSADGNNG